jgi:hypothetical protein
MVLGGGDDESAVVGDDGNGDVGTFAHGQLRVEG